MNRRCAYGKTPAQRPRRPLGLFFALAEAYFIAHGHLLIPHDYLSEGRRLGRWIGTQRSDYRKGTNPSFTRERVEKLEAIGMVWTANDLAWQTMCRELADYRQRYGTARVPQSYVTPGGKRLGSWVNKQRVDQKRNRLLPERKAQLERLGMIWDAQTLRLLQIHLEHNNGVFPKADHVTRDGVKLGLWLGNQRQYYRTGKLLPHRRAQLEELGVEWAILGRPRFTGGTGICASLKPGASRRMTSWVSG